MPLQRLCRQYLQRLNAKASQYGLSLWLKDIIKQNENGQCKATEEEVEMLARAVDDDRISRKDIPKILDKSYRQCVDDDDFDKIKKFRYVGIYSKISVLLHKIKSYERNNNVNTD